MELSPVETEGDHQWMWIEKATAAEAVQPELKLKYLTAGNNYKRLQTIPLNNTFLISPAIRAKELFFPSGYESSPAVLLTVR